MDTFPVAFGFVVLAAFVVEAALGFGSTVVAVSLGALLLPLDVLLPAFVPLNLVISSWIVARDRRLIAGRLLAKQVLPLMGLGLPVGMLALGALEPSLLKRAFGAFVVALALLELWRARPGAVEQALSRAKTAALLLLGGVVHGAFATGGPLVVYVFGRTLSDKGTFRATLSALWLALNLVLVVGYAVQGQLDAESLLLSAKLAPFLLAGMGIGELLHKRAPAELFKRLVFGLLLVAGLLLVTKG